ncbi:MAG: hypothetical protein PHF35_01350 [Candidatus Moranbacteria bacterium]|nr:hypothetical protein [Candidatus Moranbacteria bacterium]
MAGYRLVNGNITYINIFIDFAEFLDEFVRFRWQNLKDYVNISRKTRPAPNGDSYAAK